MEERINVMRLLSRSLRVGLAGSRARSPTAASLGDTAGDWPVPLTTKRSGVQRPHSIGVLLRKGSGEGSLVFYSGGRADCATGGPHDHLVDETAGQVHDSQLVQHLERQNKVQPFHDPARFSRLTHYVLLLKECVDECVSEDLAIVRLDGTTVDAAHQALTPTTRA